MLISEEIGKNLKQLEGDMFQDSSSFFFKIQTIIFIYECSMVFYIVD